MLEIIVGALVIGLIIGSFFTRLYYKSKRDKEIAKISKELLVQEEINRKLSKNLYEKQQKDLASFQEHIKNLKDNIHETDSPALPADVIRMLNDIANETSSTGNTTSSD